MTLRHRDRKTSRHPHGRRSWAWIVKPLVATVLASAVATIPTLAGAIVPVQCAPTTVSIAVGGNFTLSLSSDGKVKAWGDNYFGEMGNGTVGGYNTTPGLVSNLTGVTTIAAGAVHALALKSDGTVWAWGDGEHGQLGNGQMGFGAVAPTPQLVSGLTDIVSISAGSDHSLALTSDGTVWAWGRNDYGQLGNGTTYDSAVPVQLPGLTGVTVVAAGGLHSLVAKSDGKVWAWGRNHYGQLGNATTTFAPTATPQLASVLTGVTAVAGGSDFSLALTSGGLVYGFGNSNWGQLGPGVANGGSTATPTQVTGISAVSAIAAGGNYSAAIAAGKLYTWGGNAFGQLGRGFFGSSSVGDPTPTQVGTLTTWRAISPATEAVHGTALTSDGKVWTWGYNSYGQLGDGATASRSSPYNVASATQAVPGAPTNLQAAAGAQVAYLTWDAPTSVVTQYVVTPYIGGVAQPEVATKVPRVSFPVSGLTKGTTYSFTVAAQNCLGAGSATSQSNRVVPTGVQLSEDGFKVEAHPVNDRMRLGANTFNGNVKLAANDLYVAGRGPSIAVGRAWNSRASGSSIFGDRWSSSIGTDVRLDTSLANGSVFFHGPGGAQIGFPRNADGTFAPPTGINATLVQNPDSTYTLRFQGSGDKLSFSSAGVLTSAKDRNANSVTYAYGGPGGRISALTNSQGVTVSIAYNASNLVSSVSDSTGRSWAYAYTSGKLTQVTDAKGGITGYTYDGSGNLTKVTTPGNRVVDLAYDVAGRVTSITWHPQAGVNATTGFAYASGVYGTSTTTVTDANGLTTTYTFDPVGRTTNVVDGLGNTTSLAYTSTSNVRRYTRPAGGTTSYGYVNVNSLSSASAPTGASSTFTYGDSAHPDLPTLVTDAQGNHVTLTYDAAGNPLTQTTDLPAPTNQVQLTYNADGTPATAKDVKGNQTNYGYTSGNLTSTTPPVPLGATSYTYDTLNRLRTATDGKGQTQTITYDALDRITNIAYADGSSVAYVYDPDGNLVTQVDATGTTTMVYDGMNRLVSRTTSDGLIVSYTFDGLGNLTSMTDAGGTVRYSYNQVNLPSAIEEPGHQATAITYDKNYNRAMLRLPNGLTQNYTYDDSNRLTGITVLDAKLATLLKRTYSYKAPDTGTDTALRQTMTDEAGNVTTYTYDMLNRLTDALTKDKTGKLASDYAYVYDPAGNRTSQTVNNGTTTTVTTYGYNAANELTTTGPASTVSYTYDANGNLVGSSVPNTAATYNTADQTTSMQTRAGREEYRYRGTGQAERTTIQVAGQPLVIFGNSVLGVSSQTVAGNATTYYTHDARGTLVGQRTRAGNQYLLTDGIGSVIGVSDASGRMLTTYGYDPFGQIATATGAVSVTPWGYAGQYLDSTGLYHMGARYYDPSLGRWTQQDSVFSPLDPMLWNRYVYVGNDPVNFSDPSGLSPWDWVKNAWNCMTSSLEAGFAAGAVLFFGAEVLEAWSAGLAAAIAAGTVAVTAYAVLGAVIVAAVVVAVAAIVRDRC